MLKGKKKNQVLMPKAQQESINSLTLYLRTPFQAGFDFLISHQAKLEPHATLKSFSLEIWNEKFSPTHSLKAKKSTTCALKLHVLLNQLHFYPKDFGKQLKIVKLARLRLLNPRKVRT